MPSDNEFAKEVLRSIQSKSLSLPKSEPSSVLCEVCRDLCSRIWEPRSYKTYQVQSLKRNSEDGACDLCRVIWNALPKREATAEPAVRLTRFDSSIKINDERSPSLSIHKSPSSSAEATHDVQLGYPGLSEGGSETHFEIIRQWLEHCDNNHRDCCPTSSLSAQKVATNADVSTHFRSLPKRVIHVGKPGDDKVYLRETSSTDNGEWIALSHQWGTGEPFRTLPENLPSHIDGIPFSQLPETFRDAVKVTRAIGCPYLWIDSLCIIQGPDGDFKEEAKRMGDVYNGAYCVLAAARSPGHHAGFLQPREPRATVTLQRDANSAPFYICEAIDKFDVHVLQSSLNKRGWVFQEHALARRTVYFTDHQTYFECGDGIQCETMTKMRNELATFMGDPSFPQIIMGASRGERILRFQDLYKTYSTLGLSEPSDRPMAIDSLQVRVLKAFEAKGGYGILDEEHKGSRGRGLLRRSLLWRRAYDTLDMSPITFLPHHGITHVPSWSWMKYTGSIDYISPPFGNVDWDDLQSPWTSDVGVGDVLLADAREYDASSATKNGEGEIIFDRTSEYPPSSTKCIVLGRKRGLWSLKDKHRVHYLLVVEPSEKVDREGRPIYKRVGAGYLPGSCIDSEREGVSVH